MGTETFGIGEAVARMQAGKFVSRKGWNRSGMYLGIQNPDSGSVNKQSYIWIMPTADSRVPWVASQTDLLSNDWQEVILGGATA